MVRYSVSMLIQLRLGVGVSEQDPGMLPSGCIAADPSVYLGADDSNRIWAQTNRIQIWTVHYLIKIRAINCRDEWPDWPLCTALQEVAWQHLPFLSYQKKKKTSPIPTNSTQSLRFESISFLTRTQPNSMKIIRDEYGVIRTCNRLLFCVDPLTYNDPTRQGMMRRVKNAGFGKLLGNFFCLFLVVFLSVGIQVRYYCCGLKGGSCITLRLV